jgi:hypothetical protein
MKHIKHFEIYNTNDVDKIYDLLVGKKIIATNDKLHNDMPIRISSDNLEFTPKAIRMFDDVLKVYVEMNNVKGNITNLSEYSDEMAKCFIMSSWIYWEIISKNVEKHYNVMVYPY